MCYAHQRRTIVVLPDSKCAFDSADRVVQLSVFQVKVVSQKFKNLLRVSCVDTHWHVRVHGKLSSPNKCLIFLLLFNFVIDEVEQDALGPQHVGVEPAYGEKPD